MANPTIDYEDKDLVIFAVFVLCVLSILALDDANAVEIVEKAMYGLFGIVTGRSLTNK